jgi:hypothetical protein
MGDPYTRRTALAMLLLMAAWAIALLWFSSTGLFVAAGVACVALAVALPLL